MNLFQDQDVRGVTVKNYTQSVLEEVTRIRQDQKNVSNWITVVIGKYICVIQFNLFCVHLILRGCDPSDMELVNTEIGLQISYMM